MMSNTISFRDIVKLVHPDLNPSITDAGVKMHTIKLYRDNESMLHRLGVQWGIIRVATAPQQPRTHTPRQEAPRPRPQQAPRDDYNMFRRRNRIFQPGDVVYCRTKRGRVFLTKVTESRVYFTWNGKESYAAKKNVRF
jgi:hypothetical protein